MKLAHFLTRWGEGFSRSWPPHGRRITFVRQGEGTQIRVASILRRRRFLAVCLLSFCAFLRQPAGAAPNRPETSPDRIDFSRAIRPILADKCFACHGPDASNNKSELRFDSAAHALADLGEGQS